MSGLFVFDQQNDIIFTQYNDNIRRKLYELSKKQELLPNDAVNKQCLQNIFFNQKMSSKYGNDLNRSKAAKSIQMCWFSYLVR